MAVVVALGARPSGQASSIWPIQRSTLALRARVESAVPVMATTGTFIFSSCPSEARDLGRLAAVRQDQDDVLRADAAQVAVDRLGRVQKVARRAGRRQRGRDLLGDDAGLADAAGDDLALAPVEHAGGLGELAADAARRPSSASASTASTRRAYVKSAAARPAALRLAMVFPCKNS